MDSGTYVAAGYLITAVALVGYAATLLARAKRARRRAMAVADRQARSPR